jgi:hypothetical protein
VIETKLQDTAYHEAGHAVAAWCYGQLKKRDYVTIVPDARRGSLGHLRNPPRFISEIQREGRASGRATLQAEKFVVACLAGNVAECRYRGGKKKRFLVGGRQDREQAVEILSHFVESNEELKAYSTFFKSVRRMWSLGFGPRLRLWRDVSCRRKGS